jgi:hypothetical protein
VTAPDPRSIPARYEVRELSEIQSSHHGQSFSANPNYQGQNDRDYSRPENQQRVIEQSSKNGSIRRIASRITLTLNSVMKLTIERGRPLSDSDEQATRENTVAQVESDPERCLAEYTKRFGNVLNADNAATLFDRYNGTQRNTASRSTRRRNGYGTNCSAVRSGRALRRAATALYSRQGGTLRKRARL